jgi:hypothetical protein
MQPVLRLRQVEGQIRRGFAMSPDQDLSAVITGDELLGSLDLLDLPNHIFVTCELLWGISIPQTEHCLLVSSIQATFHIAAAGVRCRAKLLNKRSLHLVKVAT